MKNANAFAIALVTAPDVPTARRLAKTVLRQRLVACANLIPRIESHFWWRGKIEMGAEVLMIFKTTKELLPKLEKLILAAHPYDTPEFLVLPLDAGSSRYLAWLGAEVGVPQAVKNP